MLVNDAPMATAGLIDHRERVRGKMMGDVFVGAQRGAPTTDGYGGVDQWSAIWNKSLPDWWWEKEKFPHRAYKHN